MSVVEAWTQAEGCVWNVAQSIHARLLCSTNNVSNRASAILSVKMTAIYNCGTAASLPVAGTKVRPLYSFDGAYRFQIKWHQKNIIKKIIST